MSDTDGLVDGQPPKREPPESLDQTADALPEFAAADCPQRIGRYRVLRVLGSGSYGQVFLGHDDQLDRPVAIKVPNPQCLSRSVDTEMYLREARMVARVEHPNIVPVHDVGSTAEYPCYVVSRYVAGTDLQQRISEGRLTFTEAARLVSQVAEALHHAHTHEIVHRDIKPANILIADDGTPFVADFGLALREDQTAEGRRLIGSPAYMSPEQARGESHRVDGRSDIYSLGVVLYELLTGRRTFQARTQTELLSQIATRDPRPPRQIDDHIPRELERICLKALARRMTERYTTAADMAEELRLFAGRSSGVEHIPQSSTLRESDESSQTPVGSGTARSADMEVRVVPKGLRAFDEHDSDFFLELLPGPRDRDGLPESLRFWKHRIENFRSEQTFPVGLMYGPSGCGKSSMVCAGLLPRLSKQVEVVYVECTPGETESRLQLGLRQLSVGASERDSLADLMYRIRTTGSPVPGGKVLVVLDQFEQWLHSQTDPGDCDLVEALRQCDGPRLQCLILVRDDFWLAISRFMQQLEVPLSEGHNSALVDLFDLEHARKVLVRFGQAFGRVEPDRTLTPQQEKFIAHSISELAEDGRVICVRLALFAEMIKGQPWTVANLRTSGGTEGIGVAFLDATFAAPTASPSHRYHQSAARGVLQALMPADESQIRGQMRSRGELLQASGYVDRPLDFEELVRILDTELRLITPTDPQQQTSGQATPGRINAGQHSYQLTHDYLVPALREWLTRKQRETRRGRAMLRLAACSTEWNRLPSHRRLPSVWEYLSIRWYTSTASWSVGQDRMMRQADRYYGIRAGLTLLVLCVAFWGAFSVSRRVRSESLVSALLSAQGERVPDLLDELAAYRNLAEPRLREFIDSADGSPTTQRQVLHARLALVQSDPEQLRPLVDSLLSGDWSYVRVIRDRLPYRDDIEERMWSELRADPGRPERRLKAAMVLAGYSRESERWTDADREFVLSQLLATNTEYQPMIRAAFRRVRHEFLPQLQQRFRDPTSSEVTQLATANAIADWAADAPEVLSESLAWSELSQWPAIFRAWRSVVRPEDYEALRALTRQPPPPEFSGAQRITLGRMRANSAIALARNQELDAVLAALEVHDDPEALTQFVARCEECGVPVETMLQCLNRVEGRRERLRGELRELADRRVYAILLALGQYPLSRLSESEQAALKRQLAEWYQNEPDAAVHAASGWLLRQWGEAELADRIDRTEVPYQPGREWFTVRLAAREASADATSGVRELFLTFVVFEAGDYRLAPLSDQADGAEDLNRVSVRLTRRFAMLDREITRAEYEAFGAEPDLASYRTKSLSAQHAMCGPSWFDAVRFSRWATQCAGFDEAQQCYPAPIELGLAEYPKSGDEPQPDVMRVHLERDGFRLPTVAEWEVACRAGMQTAFSYGSDPRLLSDYGWFLENSGQTAHPVRMKRPNLKGLFDMHGNAVEWCHNWRSSQLVTQQVEDPSGPGTGVHRISRGGSWGDTAWRCRISLRYSSYPAERYNGLGIRLCCSLPDE